MSIAERIESWKQNPANADWYNRHYDPQHDGLRLEILADAELEALAEIGNDVAIAERLPPRTRLKSTFVTRKGLTKIIGEVAVATVITAIRAATTPADNSLPAMIAAEIAVGRLEMLSLSGGGIDLADSLTQNLILELVTADVLTLEQEGILLAACTEMAGVSVGEVSAALLPFRVNGCVGEVP
jgi:hypothetical protein